MKRFSISKAHGVVVLVSALVLAACSDSSGPDSKPSSTGAATIQATAEQAQTSTPGTTVPEAPAVVVKDAKGTPVSGVTVTFTVTSGGGFVQNPSAVTDAQGRASSGSWTLGNSVGTNAVTAKATGLPSVFFIASATIGT